MGPICAKASAIPPAPASAPTSGIPVRTVARKNAATPTINPGNRTASNALLSDPAFRPPTNPAINGPITGNQNNNTDNSNIQNIPLKILPCLTGIF